MVNDRYKFPDGQYWQEHEFRDERNRSGDSWSLRLCQWATFIQMYMGVYDLKKIIDNIALFKRAVAYCENNPGLTNDNILMSANQFLANTKTLESLVTTEQDKSLKQLSETDSWKDIRRDIDLSVIKLFSACQIMPGPKQAESISEERSRYMLRSASNSGKTGVWKIGDQHMKHMLLRFQGGHPENSLLKYRHAHANLKDRI